MASLKSRAKPFLRSALRAALAAFAYVTAPGVRLAGATGYGTRQYLNKGVLPVAIHYYQPVFDADAVSDGIWDRRHELPGIDFDEIAQLRFLEELGEYGSECEWPESPEPGAPDRYFWGNESFGYTSACLLHAVVRRYQPAKVIEVGAGMSSLVLANALRSNQRLNGRRADFTTIDPYPPKTVSSLGDDIRTLIPSRVQDMSIEHLTSVRAGDLVFIDSSHVVRTGGDVNYLYLEILPRLPPGVVVHIHDIQLPYEYWKSYSAQTGAPKLFWTEQYLLQAFLALNPAYRILLAGYWSLREHAEAFGRSFPGYQPEIHRPTTSLYIQRVEGDETGTR